MKKPKTALFTALIAAVCAAFAAVPPTGGAPARAAEREEICSVTSVFSEGGEAKILFVRKYDLRPA